MFNLQSEILVTKLKEESKKRLVDIQPFIARCTLDIICRKLLLKCYYLIFFLIYRTILEAAMGTSVNAQSDLDSEYVQSINYLLKLNIDRMISPLLGNEILYMFTESRRKEKRALKVVHGLTKSVINSRKSEFFSDSKNYEESVDSLGRKKRRAFLDLLLDYSIKDPSFTEDDIRQEVDTFMFEVINHIS